MAERHILLFSRPSCRAFVSLPAAGTVESLLCCPAAGTVGLSAQLAYKSSCPFRKHRNSRPQICVSGPFRAQKLVVAPENRNWSRGGSDIDPRPRQLCQKGAASLRQGNKGGVSTAPAALSKRGGLAPARQQRRRIHGSGKATKEARPRPQQLCQRGASTIPAALTKGAVRRPFINTPPQSQIPDSMHPPLTLDNSGSWQPC